MITITDITDPARPLPTGPVRLHNLARILSVSLWRTGALRAWLESRVPYIDHPYDGPLANRPLAGCWELAKVATVLRAEPLPDVLREWGPGP